MIMKLCIEQYVLKLYKVYINDDPEFTLTHFKTMSKLEKLVFAKVSVSKMMSKLEKLVFAQVSGEHLQDHWSSGRSKEWGLTRHVLKIFSCFKFSSNF